MIAGIYIVEFFIIYIIYMYIIYCRSGIEWWNCNSNKPEDPRLVCINYDLTCDYLPNCADFNLPNPDEKCDFQVQCCSQQIEMDQGMNC